MRPGGSLWLMSEETLAALGGPTAVARVKLRVVVLRAYYSYMAPHPFDVQHSLRLLVVLHVCMPRLHFNGCRSEVEDGTYAHTQFMCKCLTFDSPPIVLEPVQMQMQREYF